MREKKQFAEGELIELIEPSPERTTPECPYFGRCGGCSYQHISYAHQLELKARQVEQAMRRIGRLAEPPMRPMVPSPLPYRYRNRITVHAEDDVIGFYRRDVHELMDIERCPISMPEVNDALARLRADGSRDGHYTLRAHSGPRVFAQTNDAVADAMADYVARIFSGEEKLLIDAFCGAGFFTKRLAPQFDRVVGIDWDRFAIDAARKDAGPNEATSPATYASNLRWLLEQSDLSFDRVDRRSARHRPHRGNAARHSRNSAANSDLRLLQSPDARARPCGTAAAFHRHLDHPFDMFPQTAEIEAVAHLESL